MLTSTYFYNKLLLLVCQILYSISKYNLFQKQDPSYAQGYGGQEEKMKMNTKLLTLLAVLTATNHMYSGDTQNPATMSGSSDTTQKFHNLRPHVPGQDGSGTQTMPGKDGSGTQDRFGKDGHGQHHLFGPGGQRQMLQDLLTLLQQGTPDVQGAIAKINDALSQPEPTVEPTSGSGTSDAAPTDTSTGTTVQS